MRLTLRTLLAYLDGNLEPNDSQDVGKKIEESEFASKLVHLIRDCTRRLRLGVPPLVGRGLAADPNTVAEYLEYRLSDEKVPEFERICLESEIHLAEVASCHQILTLVLGEPAEIDQETRARLYGLSAQADAPPPADAVKTAARAPASLAAIPPAPPVRRPKPEVPEYLRESRWRFWPVAALVLIVAPLTFAGLWMFGSAQWREPVAGLVGPPAEPQASDAPAAPGADAPSEAAHPIHPAADKATAELPPTSPSDATSVPAPAVVAPAKPSGEDPDAPPAPEPSTPGAPRPEDPVKAATSDPPAKPLPDEPLAPAPPSDPAKTPLESPPAAAPSEAKPPAATEVPKEAAAREPAMGFGRFTSKREVLLKFDPTSGNWLRLPAASGLAKGDRLLSLPSFRPTITLSSNITLQADGPALFELSGWTDDGVPIIAVEYGRLFMLTDGKANNPLQLKIDAHEPLLTFIDAESTLAIEVRRDLPAGKDPEAGAAPLSANVYATSGLIRVRQSGEAPVELQSPSQRSMIPTPVQQPEAADFPAWVTTEEQSDFDPQGPSQVDGYLTSTKPAELQLRELSDDRHKLGHRREVRALAIRSLVYLGDYEPCIAAIDNAEERLFWPAAMDELRAAVARSPESAAAVRAALESKRGAENGAALYRVLWGYSSTDLKDGADRQLVEMLDSDSLDFRVLSFLTLKELTGATHGYGPDDRDIKRRTAYNAWKQHNFNKPAPRSGGSSSKKGAAKGG